MNAKTTQKLIYFYVTLLIIAGIVVGNTINRIELHMVVRRVITEGINYDDFRDMALSDKMIQLFYKDFTEAEVKAFEGFLNRIIKNLAEVNENER
jgi:hypothetical protein